MNLHTLFRALCILILALASSTATAAPLDKSANGKIDEAINVHYLSTNFDKAEGLLLGTLKACGDRCSNGVKARAWMYIGIVRGAGKQDMDGAAAAFMEALTLDSNTKLDVDLSTPELKQLFEESSGAIGDSGSSDDSDDDIVLDGSGGSDMPMGGGIECTPDVAEVETRRPVPVACRTSEPAARMVLYFREFGADRWSQKNMGKGGEYWLATIPCGATGIQGTLAWYVVASNAQGEPIDSYASEAAPNEISLVSSTTLEPPAYPDQKAPARCVDMAECPEDMRGTPACPDTGGGGEGGGGGGWGDSCQENSECQSGLACIDGTCESAPSCDSDADCSGGECIDFVCHYADSGGDASDTEGPRNFIGIHFGADFASVSGTSVCSPAPEVNSAFECYLGSRYYQTPLFQYDAAGNPTQVISQYNNPASPSYDPLQSGQIGSTLALSTLRALVSFEHLFTSKIGVEGRAGLAFRGAPSSGTVDLLHAAVRAKYWFTGTGPGLRIFGLVGGGLAQVDAQQSITVREFQGDNSPAFNTTACNQTQPSCDLAVTAYKKLGTTFVTGGLGAFMNLGGHGPSFELNGRIMFPASGFVVQPNVGWLIGF